MGFGGATNAGMRLSCGEYLILLNNDCKILSPAWIKLLEAPFIENPKVGITGPIKYWSEITKAHALIFFCVMIHRKVVDKIGFLDDKTFPIGAGEDTDFCARAQKAGFLIEQVPKEGLFPIYHLGEATLNTIPDWNERLYWEHREALKKKYAV
jgi:GT2 family glycosyltransferase